MNAKFVKRTIEFSSECQHALRREQERIHTATGAYYPLMNLVDMYFWQIGYEAEAQKVVGEPDIPA